MGSFKLLLLLLNQPCSHSVLVSFYGLIPPACVSCNHLQVKLSLSAASACLLLAPMLPHLLLVLFPLCPPRGWSCGSSQKLSQQSPSSHTSPLPPNLFRSHLLSCSVTQSVVSVGIAIRFAMIINMDFLPQYTVPNFSLTCMAVSCSAFHFPSPVAMQSVETGKVKWVPKPSAMGTLMPYACHRSVCLVLPLVVQYNTIQYSFNSSADRPLRRLQ